MWPRAKSSFETINHFWSPNPELAPPEAPPTLGWQCACFPLRGRAREWCCGELSCPIASTETCAQAVPHQHISLCISGTGYPVRTLSVIPEWGEAVQEEGWARARPGERVIPLLTSGSISPSQAPRFGLRLQWASLTFSVFPSLHSS